MTQHVRIAEPAVTTEQRFERAVTRIRVAFEQGNPRARFILVALEKVAEDLEEQHKLADLPGAEQRLWGAVGAKFSDAGAVARGRVRSAEAFASLVERSICGDAALAEYLGVDRSRVSQRLADHSLYAFEAGPEERCFPEWQFASKKPLRGLKTVLSSLDSNLHPLVVDHWFTTPSTELLVEDETLSPAEWLRTGGDPKALVGLLPA